MTSHYIDLRLLPDPEVHQRHIMGALLGRLHLALVQRKSDAIGVSFPVYSLRPPSLGAMLRLHGSEQDLQALMKDNWLGAVCDHVAIGVLQPVPKEGVTHRMIRRRQFKTSIERLRRRRMARKGETAEQAETAIPQLDVPRPNLPYVQVRSSSTGHTFSLFVEHGAAYPTPIEGRFNSYGLSDGATVPWF